MKSITKSTAGILAAVLFMASVPAVSFPVHADPAVITIRTKEDLMELAGYVHPRAIPRESR